MINLETLRSFLTLGARAGMDGIPEGEVLRQEQTVLSALQRLETCPGLALADEVGMGKTFEALGIAAAVRHKSPESRIVVVTPGPDLCIKWSKDIGEFRAMYDFGSGVVAVRTLGDFVEAVRTHPIVIAPITMFRTGGKQSDQAQLLALYCSWKELPHQTVHAIFRRVFPQGQAIPDLDKTLFLDKFEWKLLKPRFKPAFQRGQSGGPLGLDDLYGNSDLDAFCDGDLVTRALNRARFDFSRHLLPKIDLLVVDEAHKLKNPGSLQTTGMRHVFERRFEKAVLLTATPFQLDVAELREIFRLFAQAATAPPDLMMKVDMLLNDIRRYQEQYDTFQQTWLNLDPLMADEFSARYQDQGMQAQFDDAGLRVVQAQINALRQLKDDKIQPGLRSWMIRSLRPHKRTYRRSKYQPVRASGPGVLPFLLYERFITELFYQKRPTHKASVEINMVSSYAAAATGTLMSSSEALPPSAETYRTLLRDLLPDEDAAGHPKVMQVVADAIDAADKGEKTLIFCSRTETVRQLGTKLGEAWEAKLIDRWRDVYPMAQASDIFGIPGTRHRGRQPLLQARFHRTQDALYLTLREPCLPEGRQVSWALERMAALLEEANALLSRERVGKTSAERVDYAVVRKCLRHAAIRLWEQERSRDELTSDLNMDGLLSFDLGNSEPGSEMPTWHIDAALAHVVLEGGPSLWKGNAELLGRIPIENRNYFVERLARYLTYMQVPFLAELLSHARVEGVRIDPVESSGLLRALQTFWTTPIGASWTSRLRDFIEYVAKQSIQQQAMILDDMETTQGAGFVRHTLEAASRERLRQLFNTPLFPIVLVANAVMQEGLDLHRQCRRVIHHDLEWNPAQVEQRIGRVDRLGSLTSRMREKDPNATLDVLYPAIRSTIDERLYRTVKMREKWLEFLLGAHPQFDAFTFSDEIPRPLPQRLANELAVKLEPESF